MADPFDHRSWTGHTERWDPLVPILPVILGGFGFLVIGLIML